MEEKILKTSEDFAALSDEEKNQFGNPAEIRRVFTQGVGLLKGGIFKQTKIGNLAEMIWDVFHHKYVSLCAGPPVKTLTFCVLKNKKTELRNGFVFVPRDWLQMVTYDNIMQLGAILYCGSQAVDFYNNRFNIDSSQLIMDRATSYESEYLRLLQQSNDQRSKFELNQYQNHILETFPSGFEAKYVYQYKQVLGPN